MNYKNPIIYTDYSDPDVIRVEEDYYMVASSFANTPILPILHSKNLVDWELINYVAEQVPFDYYEFPMHGCGVWAPSLRYHNGVYYCFVPFPDEGIYVYKTKDIYGKWEEPVCLLKNAGWIDPCPLFDDDGRVYMVNAFAKSRIGFKDMLHVCELSPECDRVLDTGHFVFDGTYSQPTIEGPKFYKRNGYYYIFAPSGGVKTGWQVVLRSKNVYGPYEIKTVLVQGSSKINGPHQGGWIDTPFGEDWFIHFQDVHNGGRIVHLQPVKWIEDWPVMGNPVEGQDYGEALMEYSCPKAGESKVEPFNYTDMIIGGDLNPNWQWNANYSKEWYFEEDRKLCLRAVNFDEQIKAFGEKTKYLSELTTMSQDLRFSIEADKNMLCNRPNLLTLKQPSERPSCTAQFDLSGLKDGDRAGFGVLGDSYSAVCVEKQNGILRLVKIQGERIITKIDGVFDSSETKPGEEEKECLFEYDKSTVSITLSFTDENHVKYSVGDNKIPGENLVAPGRWVGAKLFMFADSKALTDGFIKVLKLDLER